MTQSPVAMLSSLVREWGQTHLDSLPSAPPAVACQNPDFGHYQSNWALVGAKSLKKNPRELAQSLVDFSRDAEFLESSEIAGPGFVNFRFTRKCLEDSLTALVRDPACGISPAPQPRTIVIDFSSPNVAKEMHVGHIRSTILGDALARIISAKGHRVIRDNHIGDWGTQFGKLILGYKERGRPALPPGDALEILQEIYQSTHQACEADATKLENARAELKALQDGDPENLAIWQEIRESSQAAFEAIYDRLGVRFDYSLGESFYNPWLTETVEDLRAQGIAQSSEGATVVFFDRADLKEFPFLIQKSDGAALYSTTDLATLRYRYREWKADEAIYVTDGRQQLHFKQLFETAKRWGIPIDCHHVWFGAILGPDKKPLKTREGTPLKLKTLLDEAEARSLAILQSKRPDLSEEAAAPMARIIGVGSLKYADLAQNRNLDYVFSWDKLLSFDGNTAPYLLNAYVRTRSILRKAEFSRDQESSHIPILLETQVEQALARHLLEFSNTVDAVLVEYRPHLLCQYLYELAGLFHRFFEHCPVLRADSPEKKDSRLRCCFFTGEVLRKGLNLLGIETLEEM